MNKIMKSAIIFKQMFIAMAALTMVGCLSSCKDQSFDWDAAHANTAQEKFTEVFIREFGKPAEGHQWGFDMAWETDNATRSVDIYNSELVVVKPEGHVISGSVEDGTAVWEYNAWSSGGQSGNYGDFINKYGAVPFISEQEHKDVYDWFSKHKVSWENTTELIGNLDDGCTYTFYNEAGAAITPTEGTEYKGTVVQVKDGDTKTYKDIKYVVNTSYTDSKDNYHQKEIVKLVYYSSFSQDNPSFVVLPDTRNEDGGTAIWTGVNLESWNTIKAPYQHASTSDDRVDVGMKIDFQHAWIQYVAHTEYNNGVDDLNAGYDEKKVTTDEFIDDGGSKMNYLQIFPAKEGQGHSKDFNGSDGRPGYGICNSPSDGKYAQNMGVLALGANLNQLGLQNSNDNRIHDKWYIVYLEGKDYAGWYLGFDLEGGKNEYSGQYAANGICNDMIIKLTSVNPYIEKYPYNCRIMCEDLGGFNGSKIDVSDTRKLVSDIDYNDVVIDVQTKKDNEDIVYITLRAAGGTLPLTIWYNDNPLFETHEFFTNYTVLSNYTLKGANKDPDKGNNGTGHYLTLSDYLKMYNTGVNSIGIQTIGVAPSNYWNGSQTVSVTVPNNDDIKYVRINEKFNLANLQIKVWRHDTQDYLENTSNVYDVAEWVNLSNQTGQAPLKICVPLIKWSAERVKINDSAVYPNFDAWVGDSSKEFWNTKTDIGDTYKGSPQ